jgi:predicted aspartyl protease
VRISDPGGHVGNGAGLQIDGPKLAIEIAVPTVLAEFLARSGQPVPPARRGFALIDTGASITAVDEEVVASLGIQPIGQMKLSTPSQSRSAWLYAARLTCSGVAVPVVEVLDIVGCTLQPQGFIALLGRNFLRKLVLVYDGPAGFFTLL